MSSRDQGVLLAGTHNTAVLGNTVGSDGALGNGSDGIFVNSTDNAQVTRNTVRNSGGAGVRVAAGSQAKIEQNDIQDNDGLGIDLGPAGPTVNDTPDADGIQNYPVITARGRELTFTIDGLPNKSYAIEGYASPACDASGYGEGETLIVAAEVTTDATGHGAVTETPGDAYPHEAVTATATREDGTSSEFSPCITTTTFTVNSTADDDDGACTAAKCTLRDAIDASNAAGSPAANTIEFAVAPATTISVGRALPAITQAVTTSARRPPGTPSRGRSSSRPRRT